MRQRNAKGGGRKTWRGGAENLKEGGGEKLEGGGGGILEGGGGAENLRVRDCDAVTAASSDPETFLQEDDRLSASSVRLSNQFIFNLRAENICHQRVRSNMAEF